MQQDRSNELRTGEEILENALALWRAGYSVMPANDGHWVSDWGRFRSGRMAEEEVRTHFGGDRGFGADIAVFCGPVSGDVYTIEFDNHTGSHGHAFGAWKEMIPADLYSRLCVFETKTPGGYRVVWRCKTEPAWYGDDVAVVLHDGRPRAVVECLTQFKAPGGYTRAYEYVSGPPLTELSGYITPTEQELLLDAATRFHEYDPPRREYTSSAAGGGGGDRPGDYFDARADWREILERAGWWWVKTRGGVSHWTRPGTRGGKTSATTNYAGGNRLFVFSSDADPFEKDASYSPFQALALLHFGGDFRAAATAVSEAGFGTVPPFREYDPAADAGADGRVEEMFRDRPAPVSGSEDGDPQAEPGEQFDPAKYRPDDAPAGWNPPLDLKVVAGGTVPLFPVEHLAVVPEFRRLVEGVADSVQIAPDVPALMGLAVLSAACSDRVRVAVRPGCYLPAILWTATALEPGERKSAAVEPVIRPIKLWEETQRRELAASVQIQKAHRKVARERVKAIEKRLATATEKGEADDLTREYVECERLLAGPEPEEPRILVDDATSEALVPVLQRHGRAACLSDEATFLEVAMGRYSNDPKLELYMKGHDGGDYRCDRAGRESMYLARVNLTFGFCIQTDALKRYAADPVAQGRGFFPRFLIACPRSLLGTRKFRLAAAGDPGRVQAGWDRLVTRLLDARATRVLDHSDAGYRLIEEFEQRYEPLLADAGGLAPVRAWVSKAVSGQMLRVAGLLHVASGSTETVVGTEFLAAAVGIVEYLLEHTKHLYKVNGEDRALALAQKIKNTIVLHKWGRVTRDQFKRFAYVGKDVTDGLVGAAYEYLTAANVVRAARASRQTTHYDVNPALLA